MNKPIKKSSANRPVLTKNIDDFSIYIRYPVVCHYVAIKTKAFLEFDHGAGFWVIKYISGKCKGEVDTLFEAKKVYDIYFA